MEDPMIATKRQHRRLLVAVPLLAFFCVSTFVLGFVRAWTTAHNFSVGAYYANINNRIINAGTDCGDYFDGWEFDNCSCARSFLGPVTPLIALTLFTNGLSAALYVLKAFSADTPWLSMTRLRIVQSVGWLFALALCIAAGAAATNMSCSGATVGWVYIVFAAVLFPMLTVNLVVGHRVCKHKPRATAAADGDTSANVWPARFFPTEKSVVRWCISFVFPCATVYEVHETMKPGSGVPEMLMYGAMSCFCCSACGGALHRGSVRKHLMIGGTCTEDWLVHCFCPSCALTQEYDSVHSTANTEMQPPQAATVDV